LVEEGRDDWARKNGGAIESICPECYLVGAGGAIRRVSAGAVSVFGKTVAEAGGNVFATEAGTAFFWSGRTGSAGGAELAAAIAKSSNGTTLEALMAQRNIVMPAWDASNPAVVKAWQTASAQFAEGASGTVRAVIGQNLRPGNIWQTAELPALMANQKVARIITIDPATLASKVIFQR
jgi:hypothetical protein